jgi:hypothetical protein
MRVKGTQGQMAGRKRSSQAVGLGEGTRHLYLSPATRIDIGIFVRPQVQEISRPSIDTSIHHKLRLMDIQRAMQPHQSIQIHPCFRFPSMPSLSQQNTSLPHQTDSQTSVLERASSSNQPHRPAYCIFKLNLPCASFTPVRTTTSLRRGHDTE